MTIGGQWNSRLALLAHGDGRLEVLAIGRDGCLYGNSQVRRGASAFAGWRPVGAGRPGSGPYFVPGTRVGYALEPSGLLTVFATCPGGQLGYAYLVPGEGWSQWRSLRVAGRSISGSVVASGRMAATPPVVLLRDATGGIRIGCRPDFADPDGWPAAKWTELDGNRAERPSLGVSENGRQARLVLFAVGARGDIWTCSPQLVEGRGIADSLAADSLAADSRAADSLDREWVPGIATRAPGARVAGRPVPVGADGVVWRGENGSLWSATLKTPGILSEVRDLGRELGFDLAGAPATATGPGVSVLAGRTRAGRISVWRRQGGRDWAPVGLTAGYPTAPAAADPAVALGADGLADVVFLGPDRRIHHVRESPAVRAPLAGRAPLDARAEPGRPAHLSPV
jgi:hypothetical protein